MEIIKFLTSYNTDKIIDCLLDAEVPSGHSVPVEYLDPSETSNQNEKILFSYDEDGNLFFKRGYQSVCVNDVNKLFCEIESLKCLLDKHFITLPDFYLEVHRNILDLKFTEVKMV